MGCPFRRDTPPGELGGSTTDVYVGQAHGPFWLPCHNSPGYSSETRRDPKHAQCAGAAIFRANTGRASALPAGLLSLPPDKEKVFGSYAEFVSHHEKAPLDFAERKLRFFPPDLMMIAQMERSTTTKVNLPPSSQP